MSYIIYTDTTEGSGSQVIGTFRSKTRALKVADLIQKRWDAGLEDPTMSATQFKVAKAKALDEFTDESIVEYAIL